MSKINLQTSARVTSIFALAIAALLTIATIQVTKSGSNDLGPLPVDNRPRNPPFVSTPDDVVGCVVELAKIRPDDLVYDLGCGDARLAIEAAKKHGCRVIGFDIDEEAVRLARDCVKKANLEHLVEIRKQDVLTLDLSNVDVVLMYLLPEFNQQLIPQFQKMRPGSRIVSHEFRVDPYAADEVKTVFSQYDGSQHVVYSWHGPFPIEQPIDDVTASDSTFSAASNNSTDFCD